MTTTQKINFFTENVYKPLSTLVLSTLVLILAIMYRSDLKLQQYEAQFDLDTGKYNISVEYIPVEEQMARYIDTLPIPQELVQEEVQEEVLIEEEKVEEKVEAKSYIENATNLSDTELLASLMYHEEGVLLSKLSLEEAKRAHMLAGSVVIHRTNMNYMGATTIRETIFAKGQYAQSTLENLDEPVPDYVVEWAEELIEDGPIGPSDMIFQAEFEQGKGTYDCIYNQYFCTINEIVE